MLCTIQRVFYPLANGPHAYKLTFLSSAENKCESIPAQAVTGRGAELSSTYRELEWPAQWPCLLACLNLLLYQSWCLVSLRKSRSAHNLVSPLHIRVGLITPGKRVLLEMGVGWGGEFKRILPCVFVWHGIICFVLIKKVSTDGLQKSHRWCPLKSLFAAPHHRCRGSRGVPSIDGFGNSWKSCCLLETLRFRYLCKQGWAG